MKRYSGKTQEIQKLWNTYLHWMRTSAKELFPSMASADVDDPAIRIPRDLDLSFQCILFCALALEFRMRSILDLKGVVLRGNTTLRPLLKCFWDRLKDIDRENRKGKCQPPPEWGKCRDTLLKLVTVRDRIVHANYDEAVKLLSGSTSPKSMAWEFHNAVVEAVQLMSIGTGYGSGDHKHLDVLKIPRC